MYDLDYLIKSYVCFFIYRRGIIIVPASEGCDKNKEDTKIISCRVLTSWLEHSKHLLARWTLDAIITLFFDFLNNVFKLSEYYSSFIGKKLKLKEIELA